MRDLVTYGIEMVVGLACLAGGVGFWRKGSRVIGAILLVLGAAAAIHAAVAVVMERGLG